MNARIIIVVYIVATALLNVSSFVADNAKGDPEFSHMGVTAPERWGALSPNYKTCSDGKLQSPIDIVKKEAVSNPELKLLNPNLVQSNATLANHGYNIGLSFPKDSGTLSINGKIYTLTQMHWHTPSEHKIDGVQYAAELHLVHRAEDDSVSVVAILYNLGNPDPIISMVQNNIIELAKHVGKPDAEADEIPLPHGVIDISQLKNFGQNYYRYTGSFTTPPCTEGVIWNVLGEVRSISKEQVDTLKGPLKLTSKMNARPCQPLNGRKVEVYQEVHKINYRKLGQ